MDKFFLIFGKISLVKDLVAYMIFEIIFIVKRKDILKSKKKSSEEQGERNEEDVRTAEN